MKGFTDSALLIVGWPAQSRSHPLTDRRRIRLAEHPSGFLLLHPAYASRTFVGRCPGVRYDIVLDPCVIKA